MIFYLGTHEPHWLGRADVPLFLSHRRLARRRKWPRARGPWALDSGGFSELRLFGRWTVAPWVYADRARRWAAEVGQLRWAAIMDWMCEPFILTKTGGTVAEHQSRTTESLFALRRLAPEVRWLPILQGWRIDDYLAHVEQYRAWGVDLAAEPLVGVGSICRRQGTAEAEELLATLAGLGLKLHGFGLKTRGLVRSAAFLESADSLAWSLRARKRPPLAGCTHESCANCFRYAMAWRQALVSVRSRAGQRRLFS